METLFNNNKATQIVSFFINLNNGILNYTKVIKLVYIADRQSFAKNKLPISFDKYVNMDNGPVVSNIYDLVRGTTKNEYWSEYIMKERYDLKLLKKAESNLLSDDEIKILTNVFNEFRTYEYYDLISYMHKQFKEWEDPEGSSNPIELNKLLEKIGKKKEEIKEIQEDLSYLLTLQNVFSITA